MSNPNWLIVEIEPYLRDCPIDDVELSEDLLKEIATEISSRFDWTEVYDQIDELARLSLRERGLIQASTLEIS